MMQVRKYDLSGVYAMCCLLLYFHYYWFTISGIVSIYEPVLFIFLSSLFVGFLHRPLKSVHLCVSVFVVKLHHQLISPL